MIKLTHHDDGKQKWHSHGISIADDLMFYDAEHDIFSHNPFDITGCGETKEEALEDFKQKFEYIMNVLSIISSSLIAMLQRESVAIFSMK